MKTAWVIGIVAIVVVVTLALRLNLPLWSSEPKPGDVPDNSVAIPYIAKSRLWATCSVEEAQTRCRIFNGAGKLLQDDVFVTYSHQTSVAAADLAARG